MRVFTVTSEGDAPGAGLTLREAVARASKGNVETLITFADGVQTVQLDRDIAINRGKITIAGDLDGDGVSDVFIDSVTHHFTIGPKAEVTLSDLLLFGGRSVQPRGGTGENGNQVAPNAADGREGARRDFAEPIPEAIAALRAAGVDGGNGRNGADGRDGGHGGAGSSAAGSIVNRGKLDLERVGFAFNRAEGGDGGDGGAGGRGAHGGNGGAGTFGALGSGNRFGHFINEDNFDGGRGGRGGTGGDGGDGGAGGRGGDAASAILNMASGVVTMTDVALGGRMAFGTLTDQFGQLAVGGHGGRGGAGGQAGSGGAGGVGGNDVHVPTDGRIWVDRDEFYRVSQDGALLDWRLHVVRYGLDHDWFFTEEPVRFQAQHYATTAAGRGGHGAAGGDGGNGGANGNGGNAATIVNYGTLAGAIATGTANDARAGLGHPDRLVNLTAPAGAAGAGGDGGTGGTERREWSFRVADIDYVPPEDYQIEDKRIPGLKGAQGGLTVLEVGSVVGDLDARYGPQDPAPDGADGLDGADGAPGVRGAIGQARRDVHSQGATAKLDAADGMVYLAGLRQDDDLSGIHFSIVRIGDTSSAVRVRYEVVGIGSERLKRADFVDPSQMKGVVRFDAIDQSAATFDADGKGIARISVLLKADGIWEPGEAFRVKLTSQDAPLGTSRLDGVAHDGDFNLIRGTEGPDGNLRGSGRDDLIMGLGGDDVILGRGGHDLLLGGPGDDRLSGGGGRDRLEGGPGKDLLDGGPGNDLLFGGEGADTLRGGGGRDALWGDAGRDFLYGGGGNDVLDGGAGDDVLTGGAGRDVFVIRDGSGRDVITDFGRGANRIDVSGRTDASRWSDIRDDIVQRGEDAVVKLGRDRVVLSGVDADDLSWGHFIF